MENQRASIWVWWFDPVQNRGVLGGYVPSIVFKGDRHHYPLSLVESPFNPVCATSLGDIKAFCSQGNRALDVDSILGDGMLSEAKTVSLKLKDIHDSLHFNWICEGCDCLATETDEVTVLIGNRDNIYPSQPSTNSETKLLFSAYHRSCVPDSFKDKDPYYIEGELNNTASWKHWSHHLLEKTWFSAIDLKNFAEFIRQQTVLGDDSPSYECVVCEMAANAPHEYNGACEDCYAEALEDHELQGHDKYYRRPDWLIEYQETRDTSADMFVCDVCGVSTRLVDLKGGQVWCQTCSSKHEHMMAKD